MTAHKPLLSNEDIERLCSRWLPRLAQDWDVAWKMREIYEEDRKKKDELIQKLVDAGEQVISFCGEPASRDVDEFQLGIELFRRAKSDALAQGYKPSER